VPLSKKELPIGDSLFQTPWGHAKNPWLLLLLLLLLKLLVAGERSDGVVSFLLSWGS